MTQQVLARGGDWVPGTMNYETFTRSGYHFAIRYIVPSITGKMISRDEVMAAHAAGISVGFVYETDGLTWQGGKDAGTIDMADAVAALESIGAPAGTAVYHAVDSAVVPGQMSVMTSWVAGLAAYTSKYRVGIYGSDTVMAAARQRQPNVLLWQTPAWSSGRVYPDLDLFQDSQAVISGIQIDTDSQFKVDCGFWVPSQKQPPPPPSGGDKETGEMQLNNDIMVPFKPGAYTGLLLFRDFTDAANPVTVRVAAFSAAHGATVHQVTMTSAKVETVTFPEADTEAVSLILESGLAPVGVTLI